MKKVLLGLVFSFISVFAFEHLTLDTMDKKIEKGNYIVDFYATWCPPCKIVAKNLVEFDKQKPKKVTIYKVDIDAQMDLARKYNITRLPTLVYIKDGKVMMDEVGVKSVDDLAYNSKKLFD